MRPILAGAVDLARRALGELQPTGVGDHLGVTAEDECAATHHFEATLPGYRGWQWAVVVAAPPEADHATVSESALLPGPDALVGPDFVPWDQRVRPGDLAPGDLLAPPPGDPRLVPGYLETGDPVVDEVAEEIGLGRPQVLSREGREEAAERWYSEYGPDTEMARAAPGTCGVCGFFVPLAGALRAAFGVCGNAMGADGHVVHTEYGCGAHSDTPAPAGSGSPLYEAYDDAAVEVVPQEELRPSAQDTSEPGRVEGDDADTPVTATSEDEADTPAADARADEPDSPAADAGESAGAEADGENDSVDTGSATIVGAGEAGVPIGDAVTESSAAAPAETDLVEADSAAQVEAPSEAVRTDSADDRPAATDERAVGTTAPVDSDRHSAAAEDPADAPVTDAVGTGARQDEVGESATAAAGLTADAPAEAASPEPAEGSSPELANDVPTGPTPSPATDIAEDTTAEPSAPAEPVQAESTEGGSAEGASSVPVESASAEVAEAVSAEGVSSMPVESASAEAVSSENASSVPAEDVSPEAASSVPVESVPSESTEAAPGEDASSGIAKDTAAEGEQEAPRGQYSEGWGVAAVRVQRGESGAAGES